MPLYPNVNKTAKKHIEEQGEGGREVEDEIHVARPPNCFMLWSCEMRKNIASNKQSRENNADVSKHLGQMWMNMYNKFKLQYRIKADKIKYENKILYHDYKNKTK